MTKFVAKKVTKKSVMQQRKRSMSGYQRYMKAHYDRVVAENPEANFGERGRIIGKAWKSLSTEEKAKYAEPVEEVAAAEVAA